MERTTFALSIIASALIIMQIIRDEHERAKKNI